VMDSLKAYKFIVIYLYFKDITQAQTTRNGSPKKTTGNGSRNKQVKHKPNGSRGETNGHVHTVLNGDFSAHGLLYDYGVKVSIILLVYDLNKKPSVSLPIENWNCPSEYEPLNLHTDMTNYRSPGPPLSCKLV
jgi:hypothetical protein